MHIEKNERRSLIPCMALLCTAIFMSGFARSEDLPTPEMVVSKTTVPPVIDGKLTPGEWDRAPAATAFVVVGNPLLCRTQSVAYMTYDDKNFYVAIKNYRGKDLTLLRKTARRPDDDRIVFDSSNEIWFSPPGLPAVGYQTLFNSYPGVFDAKQIPSLGYTSKAWTGHWTIASSETANDWIVEAKAPISSFESKVVDGATWRALFTTDVGVGGDEGFRSWTMNSSFSDIQKFGLIHFKENSAVFQFLEMESIFTGKYAFTMAVIGAPKGKSDVTVTLRFGPGISAASTDLVQTHKVSVEDGKREEFPMSGDLTTLSLPLKKYDYRESQRAKTEKKEFPSGYCEVTATDADGTRLYHQVFPFAINGFVRTPPEKIQTTPYETPFGLQAFYAPLNKKLIVKIDRYYLDKHTDAIAGSARLLDANGKAAAERKIAPFYNDYSEFPMDLAALEVPVQTEEDWAKAKPVMDDNKKIQSDNKKLVADGKPELPLKDLPGPHPAEYTLEVTLAGADGKEIAKTTTPVKLMGYQFEWLGNNIGISDEVIPPWTPMKWSDGELSMWNKTYKLNGLGLAEKIVNAGAPQLSAMKLTATIDGKESEVTPGAPTMRKMTDAGADLSGSAEVGGIGIDVTTRAEFDGFVLNTMTLTPKTPVQLDHLALDVSMPEAEAPCFVTTSGGWNAYHGWTPEKWDSRENSTSTRQGNFVPYVLLTDSDRAFCWFADTDQGWILDENAPTQELIKKDGVVKLRINFVTKPGKFDKPTTIRYGWMVTPQKPQPKSWRGYNIAGGKLFPEDHTIFWSQGSDWAVLWPYYSSPFPWSYEKSKKGFEAESKNGRVNAAGNIAHAIARYSDYKGRQFPELAADWGCVLGEQGNCDVARTKGPTDFQVWHFDQWVKKSGLQALYFDENYLGENYNYLGGGAYLLPDERIQPGYDYLGLREYDKRLRYMFHANGKEGPNIWLHTTSGQPVYSWMPDVAMEGETVEPSGVDGNDYMDALPASRLRSIDMGVNLGAAPFVMCQIARHGKADPFLMRQFAGWCAAHDCIPESGSKKEIWPTMVIKYQLWRDEVRFLPYWKKDTGVVSTTADVVASGHIRDKQLLLWICNTSRENRKGAIELDLKKLGFDPAKTTAVDAENDAVIPLENGKFSVDVALRNWRAVSIVEK